MVNVHYVYRTHPIISTGFIFQFLMLVTFLFWLLHIILVWITVVFPHTAKKVKKRGKVIHVTMVVAVIAFSLIGPVVAVANYPYIIPRLPVFTCFSSDLNWTFYSLILPCSITFALASTFLVLLFRTTYKVSNKCIIKILVYHYFTSFSQPTVNFFLL